MITKKEHKLIAKLKRLIEYKNKDEDYNYSLLKFEKNHDNIQQLYIENHNIFTEINILKDVIQIIEQQNY